MSSLLLLGPEWGVWLCTLWLRLGGHSLYGTRSGTGECSEERPRGGPAGSQRVWDWHWAQWGLRGVESRKQWASWFDCWAEFLYCYLSRALQSAGLLRNVGWTVPMLPESCLGLTLMPRQHCWNAKPQLLHSFRLNSPEMRHGSAAAPNDLGSPEMPPSSVGWGPHRGGASWYQPLTWHCLRGRLPPWLCPGWHLSRL